MNEERWPEVRRLFEQLVGRPESERDAALTDVDAELCADVRRLLAAHAADLAESQEPPSGDEIARAVTAGPVAPERIGRFTILREIGSGGMGTVFEAQEERPNRRVALKVLHGGFVVTGNTGAASDERDAWLFKVSPSGVPKWFRSFRGLDRDELTGVERLADGIVAWGWTRSLDPIGIGGDEEDQWVVRVGQDGAVEMQAPYAIEVKNDTAQVEFGSEFEFPLPGTWDDMLVTAQPATISHVPSATVSTLISD